jgi:hypothetical protein
MSQNKGIPCDENEGTLVLLFLSVQYPHSLFLPFFGWCSFFCPLTSERIKEVFVELQNGKKEHVNFHKHNT